MVRNNYSRYRSGHIGADDAFSRVDKDLGTAEARLDAMAGVSGSYTVAQLTAITDGSIGLLAACSNASGGPTVAVFITPTWYDARTGIALV